MNYFQCLNVINNNLKVEINRLDVISVTAESVKTGISRLINDTFGVSGLNAVQRTAMEQATFKQYKAQL